MAPAEPHDYERYRAALGDERLPCAFVDLDAVDANTRVLAEMVSGSGKPIRIATKSIRCPLLVRRILERAGAAARGLMTYDAEETALYAEQGFDDLLLAYPTGQRKDAERLAEINARGATARAVVDAVPQVELFEEAARARGTRIPLVVEVDASLRAGAGLVHLGVRRSPLRRPRDVVDLARRIAESPHLRFDGIMAYEAQIAGVADAGGAIAAGATRAMKAASRGQVERLRAEVVRALASAGLRPAIVNGGGTGSLASSSRDAATTEVTCGSGFLVGHLFDGYRGVTLSPAAYFALQVVRVPGARLVTCHGGGYAASGRAGRDRLPVPALPPGLELLALEGAGEVQTPLRVPAGARLAIGDPVFFRHAKSGELAEHFAEYLLVRGDRVVARAPTYRGLGRTFLG